MNGDASEATTDPETDPAAESGDVGLTVDSGVAVITLARTAKRNALNGPFARAIVDALTTAEARGATVAVLRSATAVFCAGVDVSEPIRLDDGSPELVVAGKLLSTNLFVVSVVTGPVLAGGLILTSLSPVTIAGPDARFWLPERDLGIFPGRVLAYLEQVAPPRRALWLALTGERVDAEAALSAGLVSAVVPAARLDAHVAELARDLARDDTGFREAARDSWRSRFHSAEHVARRTRLDDLLRDNLARVDRDR